MAQRKKTPAKKSRQKARGKKASSQKPSLSRRIFKVLLSLIIFSALIGSLTFFGLYLYMARDLPDHRNYQFAETSRMYSSDGVVIRELFRTNPTERRTVVPIADLPSVIIDAVLAAEDADFYKHEGLDYLGMVRALYKMVTRGRISGGGSTITQQTVKNMLLKPERKFKRKFRELILARRLEASLTKDEILDIYLNIIYFGHGRHGIEEAAQFYFGIPARELNLSQSATIAGLIQSPEKHSPRKHPKSAKSRQIYVLKQMTKKGFIGQTQANAVINAKLPTLAPRPKSYDEYRWFTDQALKSLKKSYDIETLLTAGYRINTTLNSKWQNAAQEAVRFNLDAAMKQHQSPKNKRAELKKWRAKRKKQLGQKAPPVGVEIPSVIISRGKREAKVSLGKGEGTLSATQLHRWERVLQRKVKSGDQIPVVIEKPARGTAPARLRLASLPQAAMTVLDPNTGDVKALVGGYDWRISKFNRAVQMRRQIGSTFKPFVYAAALKSRNYTLATTLLDSPETIHLGGGKYYQPRNYTKKFVGEVSLRSALAKSINTTAIRTTMDLKPTTVINFATDCGLEGPYPLGPALALGSIESSPLILTNAFTPFANDGQRYEARMITEISKGDEVIERFKTSPKTVMSDGVAYLIREGLVEVVQRGTARRLRNLPQTVGGKTGTTNNNRDAWFVGVAPSLVSAVWVGRDNNRKLWKKATGGSAAAPIFEHFMKSIKTKGLEFPSRPDSIVQIPIDKNGLKVRDETSTVRKEYFLLGTEPKMAPKAQPTLDSLWDQTPAEPKGTVLPTLPTGNESEAPRIRLFDKAEAGDDQSEKSKAPKPKNNENERRSLFEEDLFE